ncbi:replicative DNA helicase [Clostridiales bacterium oral taxon 876 str. F0540]|nr:replicative DNA helicase [Clostridiales bacterium oral taxon 876 str. F0540]
MKFNIEAEMELLGAIIKNSNLMCDAISLDARDFYKDSHKIIFLNMKRMFEEGKVIELTTLASYLGNQLADIGGITYLSELFSHALTKDIKPYVKIIKDKSIVRNLYSSLQKSIKDIEDDKALNEIIDSIQEIAGGINFENMESGDMQAILFKFLDNLENRYKSGGKIPGIKTHIEKLNFLTGGFKKQEFIIVAARPSMGKSVFAINLSSHIAIKEKRYVALFNLEMSKDATVKRMVSNIASLESNKMRDGRLSDGEWVEVGRAVNILNTPYLRIYDNTISLNQIYSTCKKLRIQNKLDIAIIDYLGLIDGVKGENRNQEISKISRKLKMMAKELNITVIALAQLSRAPELRADHRPMLSDLRESGSIEQDGDNVMFLYRDAYYNSDSKDQDIVEIIVAKQRDGNLGTIRCKWMPEYQRICSLYGV